MSRQCKLSISSTLKLSMAPLATVGILSIGEMGMGIAKLLIAHNYRVVTNIAGRRYAKARSQLEQVLIIPALP